MILERCLCCGERLNPPQYTTHMMFCSKKCRDEFHKKHEKEPVKIQPFRFNCAQCDREVVVIDIDDHRSRFCSSTCEKKYWRHPPENHTTCNTNFHTVAEYLSWERRTNEE